MCAAERVAAEKRRPGQIPANETPLRLSHYGEWFSPFTVDDYIYYDLRHDPAVEGMDVFRFTAEDGRRIYAATVADAVSKANREISSWHVEFYSKPSAAWAEIARVQRQIDKVLAA